MARRVQNPEWQEMWYKEYQLQYKEWIKQAQARGVKDNKGESLHKVLDIESFLAEELHITQSVVHSWGRGRGNKGATYPESEEMLQEVWELLRKANAMSPEDRAAAFALYQDFCHMAQGSGRKYLYGKSRKYRELLEKYEIYEPAVCWKYMDMERRCELVDRLKKKRLSKEEADILLAFFASISAPENCGANVFRQICDSDLIWYKAEKLLRRCCEARDSVNIWIDRAAFISKKMIAPNIRFASYYWRIMDEYLDELLDKLPNQGKVKDFNLVRMAVGGYVPISFELQFAFENTDFAAMKEEYLFEPVRCEKIIGNIGNADSKFPHEVRVADHADVYDWLRREKEEHQISIEDYRMRRYYALRRKLFARLHRTGREEEILRELGTVTGMDEYRRLLPECSQVSIVDWVICMRSASERYRKENPGVFRLGFACADEAREAFRCYENELMADEDRKIETAFQYMLQVLKTICFPAWFRQSREKDLLLSPKLVELLEPELLECLLEYISYGAIEERELLENLKAIQQAFALRGRYLPELSDYMNQLHREVLSQETDSPVTKVIRKLAEDLDAGYYPYHSDSLAAHE